MSFMDFIELYLKDMEKCLNPSTVVNEHFLNDLKIIPYFAFGGYQTNRYSQMAKRMLMKCSSGQKMSFRLLSMP